MKRRAAPDAGFWMALFLNLFFQSEWLGIAVVMLALHYLLELPLVLVWLCLGIWLFWALAVTLFTGWLSRSSNVTTTPGSKRASDRIEKFRNENKS